ncbi:MAG: hypothetical protein ACTJFI_05930 [Enterococcus viikkiensis]
MKKSIFAVAAVIVVAGGIIWYTQGTSHETEKAVSANTKSTSTSSTIKETIESIEPKKSQKLRYP